MSNQPLADKMRPKSLEEFAGQEHIVGRHGPVRAMLENSRITNMIFFGPPGTGKTSLAGIIAEKSNLTLRKINATTASVGDVKDILSETGQLFGSEGILLYIDEIQYFNKKQQQTLLEYIEDGRITLIASTTENPYMSIYNAVISRSCVFEFKPVEPENVLPVLRRAHVILCEETGKNCSASDRVLLTIAKSCCGDVRRAINLFENLFYISTGFISESDVYAVMPKVMGNFDKDGSAHYELLSALQKSIRGSDPDAAIFYLAKLLEGGDLISACRRLGIIACEDIGMAYPNAPAVVKACIDIALSVGLPEAKIPLSHAAIFLATMPKSNSAYMAYDNAKAVIEQGKGLNMPNILRPIDDFKDYKYPHDYPNHWTKQQYLPDDIKDAKFFNYGTSKNEQATMQYWEKIKTNK